MRGPDAQPAEFRDAIDSCRPSRRGGGGKGGEAAERSEGTLAAAEHRGIIGRRWRQAGPPQRARRRGPRVG